MDCEGNMVVTLKNGKKVTFSGSLKMKEFRTWLQMEQSGNVGASYEYLAKLISEWDYSLDPSDPASYDELTIPEYRELVEAAAKYLMSSSGPN